MTTTATDAVTASVIVPAYTLDRWALLSRAVESVMSQVRPPLELLISIDNNPALFSRCVERWEAGARPGFPIRVVDHRSYPDRRGATVHARAHGSHRRFGAGEARNAAARIARGDVLVFLDDDASAEPDWLAQLLPHYEDSGTVAVGGPPLPNYETKRPPWFPPNFDWVFGCAYEGLPTRYAPLAHLIGANMSVRRTVFERLGGFHSIDFDDLDLCMRVAATYPAPCIYYEPAARVHHYVPANRVTWRYFWRRCFYVNREKVATFADMGSAANLRAERRFVAQALTRHARRQIMAALHGNGTALLRLNAMLVGIVMAGAGNVFGRFLLVVGTLRKGRLRFASD
ncbi:MAG TPA: glycosyltransferase [Acidimicrobiales bacterium]|nr:glycosyltransferase [Acidimicrobiales bacterium]